MFFVINNKNYLSPEQLRTATLLDAYYLIDNFPLHASETVLNNYLLQQYRTSLKDLCVQLLLRLSYHKDRSGNLILSFKIQMTINLLGLSHMVTVQYPEVEYLKLLLLLTNFMIRRLAYGYKLL